MNNMEAFNKITSQIQRELAEDLIKTLQDTVNQPREKYIYGTPLLDAIKNEHQNIKNLRNKTLEEVAKHFDAMTSLGDTAASFARYVRDMKE